MNSIKESGIQSRPLRWNSSASIESQIQDARRSIEQLWQNMLDIKQVIDTLMSIVDLKTSTSQILNLIGRKNGHSSAMPDARGENADHDERYVKKSKYDSKIAELEARITALEP